MSKNTVCPYNILSHTLNKRTYSTQAMGGLANQFFQHVGATSCSPPAVLYLVICLPSIHDMSTWLKSPVILIFSFITSYLAALYLIIRVGEEGKKALGARKDSNIPGFKSSC